MISTCRAISSWLACTPRSLLSVLAGITLTLGVAIADERQPVPDLHARVTDLTHTLDAAQTRTLTAELEALEKRKGAQIGVLVVPTTQPEDIAPYAIRVFDAWKLGRKGVDDGVLLIIAKNDKRARIEVARGLEGAIPDVAAARIIREYLTPKFRVGDFYGGIHDATDTLTKLIDGEPLPPPATDDDHHVERAEIVGVLCGIVAIFVALTIFRRLPRLPRGIFAAVAGGGTAWWLSSMLPLGLVLGFCGVAMGLSTRGAGGSSAARFGRGRSSYDGGGGWSSSSNSSSSDSSSSSSSSSGSSGDSGFSGGGGESSGGGASGSW